MSDGRSPLRNKVLSIDPGKQNGIALWSEDAVLEDHDTLTFDQLDSYLRKHTKYIDDVIVEDYTLDHRAGQQKGSKLDAVQTIGMVKYWASQSIRLTMQRNLVLRLAAMHSGIRIPATGHIPDHISAVLHGFYWFESQGRHAADIDVSLLSGKPQSNADDRAFVSP